MESQAKAVTTAETQPERSGHRGRGRAWTPEEDRTLLWLVDQVRESQDAGNVTSALEEAAGALGRTPVAVRARYYRLAGSDGNGKAGPEMRKCQVEAHEEFLSNLAGFLEEANHIPDLDLQAFVRGLHRITSGAASAVAVPDLNEQLASLKKENDRLENMVSDYEQRIKKVKDQYETLNYLVNEFINLSSVDKVTSLGDFGRRLKYQVDQFGTVMSVERI